MKVCPGARVLNNVDEGFGVVILPDGADHLEDVVCDKGGKLLNREYETRARVDPGTGWWRLTTRLCTGAVSHSGSVTVMTYIE
jgi:hypothetical protein